MDKIEKKLGNSGWGGQETKYLRRIQILRARDLGDFSWSLWNIDSKIMETLDNDDYKEDEAHVEFIKKKVDQGRIKFLEPVVDFIHSYLDDLGIMVGLENLKPAYNRLLASLSDPSFSMVIKYLESSLTDEKIPLSKERYGQLDESNGKVLIDSARKAIDRRYSVNGNFEKGSRDSNYFVILGILEEKLKQIFRDIRENNKT